MPAETLVRLLRLFAGQTRAALTRGLRRSLPVDCRIVLAMGENEVTTTCLVGFTNHGGGPVQVVAVELIGPAAARLGVRPSYREEWSRPARRAAVDWPVPPRGACTEATFQLRLHLLPQHERPGDRFLVQFTLVDATARGRTCLLLRAGRIRVA